MSADSYTERGSGSCCRLATPSTPEPITNRSGLPAIRYRVGTYASFRQAMLEAIGETEELQGWTARENQDYGLALVDLWAYLADILTFYQERLAQEAFLRTARLRESVLRLAALLDYHPARGLAATAFLSFEPQKGKEVKIPAGLKVQSVPGQDEKPQKFETETAVTAIPELVRFRIFSLPTTCDYLKVTSAAGVLNPAKAEEIAANLALGDNLLIFSAAECSLEEKKVVALEKRDWQTMLGWSPAIQTGAGDLKMSKWQRKFRLFGHQAQESYIVAQPPTAADGSGTIFDTAWTMTEKTTDFKIPASANALELDALYDDLKAGTMVLVIAPEYCHLTAIKSVKQTGAAIRLVDQSSTTKGPVSATVTTITLTEELKKETADLRQVVVYELTGPEVVFWEYSYPEKISGKTFYIPEQPKIVVERGRTLLLDDDQNRPFAVTVTEIQKVDQNHTAISFTSAPSEGRDLDCRSAVCYGNVARATHGETVAAEVLGSGDAAAAFQTFTLKKSPVTHVPHPLKPHGAANTLEVRVDGVLWQEAETLFGQKDSARVYITRVDDQDVMSVTFGDGNTGARLVSGQHNLVAKYRQGLGREGNVRPNSLTTLLDRPLGLKGVTNPGEAYGGAEPETLSEARVNAPNTVRTFNRIVSLRDFEDAAREVAGIARARATWSWTGEERLVLLTVAGPQGTGVEEKLKDVSDYLNARCGPKSRLRVMNLKQVFLKISAALDYEPGYLPAEVKQAAREVIQDFFLNRVDLGQSVYLSDIFRIIQGAKGVAAVDIVKLQFKTQTDSAEPVQSRLNLFAGELAGIEKPEEDILLIDGIKKS